MFVESVIICKGMQQKIPWEEGHSMREESLVDIGDTILRTRREKARYGTMVTVKGKPAAMVKSGTKKDFITPEEFAEDVYGKPVDHIVFKEI